MARRGGERCFLSPAVATQGLSRQGTGESISRWTCIQQDSAHPYSGTPAKSLKSREPFCLLRWGGQPLLPASRGAEHLSSKALFKVMWIFLLSPDMHSNVFP